MIHEGSPCRSTPLACEDLALKDSLAGGWMALQKTQSNCKWGAKRGRQDLNGGIRGAHRRAKLQLQAPALGHWSSGMEARGSRRGSSNADAAQEFMLASVFTMKTVTKILRPSLTETEDTTAGIRERFLSKLGNGVGEGTRQRSQTQYFTTQQPGNVTIPSANRR